MVSTTAVLNALWRHAGSCDGQMPTVPGVDECHQPVGKVADISVSMQQQVSAVQVVHHHPRSPTDQVVQRTVKMRQIQFIDRQWTFQLCNRDMYSQAQFVEQVVDKKFSFVLFMTPKIQS